MQNETHSRADRLNIALMSFAPVAPRLQYSKNTAAMSSKFLCSRSKAWRCQKKKPAGSGSGEAAVGGGPSMIGVFQASRGTMEIVQLYPLPQRQKRLVALLGLICLMAYFALNFYEKAKEANKKRLQMKYEKELLKEE